jgi:hypothetical protein
MEEISYKIVSIEGNEMIIEKTTNSNPGPKPTPDGMLPAVLYIPRLKTERILLEVKQKTPFKVVDDLDALAFKVGNEYLWK